MSSRPPPPPRRAPKAPSCKSRTPWIVAFYIALVIIIILIIALIIVNNNKNSCKSNTCTAPTAPTALSGVPSGNAVFLMWHTVSGAMSYNVYRGNSAAVTPATAIDSVLGVVFVSGTVNATFLYNGIPDNSSNFFIVTSVITAGTSNCESIPTPAIQVIIPDCSVISVGPPAPVISASGGSKSDTISITSTPVGAVRYRYFVRLGADPAFPDVALFIYDTTATSYTFTGLNSATAYRVAAAAFNSCGVEGVLSNIVTVTTS